MELKIELKCLDTKEVQHVKIIVDDWESKCVKELKDILQEKLQVPACDQKLFFQGRPLQNDNLFPLKKFYLREGDTIQVECIAQGDLKEIGVLLNDIKAFANAITSKDQNELLTVDYRKKLDSGSAYVNYDHIGHALDQLSFEHFIPWKTSGSLAHRHYFVQEGGFDAFMEVLKFASKRYIMKAEKKPSSKHLFSKAKEKDFEVLVAQLRNLNNKHMMLHMECLSLLWNFSETWHDRRLVMQKGGLPFVIKALLEDPYECLGNDDEQWEVNVACVNETAVGCLVQYAEFPDCQEVIARSSETVSKLILMVGDQFGCPVSENAPVIVTYSEYSSQIAANTLFCCACGWQTPKILVESGLHTKMIKLMQLYQRENLALSYYCILFLARIRTSPLVCLDHETAKSIDDLISVFLQNCKPIEISRFEEEHNYVWVTMSPFVSLVFSGKYTEAELQNSVVHKQEVCCESKHASTLLVEQEQTNGLATSLPVNESSVSEKNDEEVEGKVFNSKKLVNVENNLTEQSENSNSPDECNTDCSTQSCVTDEAACPSKMLGSTQTHQLGLFTLKHILYAKENRQLVESECLVPYLDCLCWHISPVEDRLLRAELSKHWSPNPPPLKTICKTMLAFVCGFEAALKM